MLNPPAQAHVKKRTAESCDHPMQTRYQLSCLTCGTSRAEGGKCAACSSGGRVSEESVSGRRAAIKAKRAGPCAGGDDRRRLLCGTAQGPAPGHPGGLLSTAYQGFHKVLSRRWALLTLVT